jgi:arabinan endo-1,5-alpha-L-arabinosidase
MGSSAPKANEEGCACGQEPVGTAPAEVKETFPRVHDPVVAKEKRTYYLFATGGGITMRSSPDKVTWGAPTRIFPEPPKWATEAIVGFRGHIWAPDISFFNGRWHVYYSVSTFGKNRSAIGLVTNVTLDPARKDYRWVDHGPVIQSYPENDYNAIDANVALDEKGQPWMSFGSFWSGLKIVPLDAKTGMLARPEEKPVGIASRPQEGPQQPGAIEAPFIVRRGRHFYLFASYDFCCRGANSTYNIRVGRADRISGPYLDRDGKSLLEGGGTPVLASTTGRWRGPGHNGFLREGRRDSLVYHAYDSEDRGASKLHIEPVTWTRDGWPTVAGSSLK